MNNTEIIKALECCGIDDCDSCPCYDEELGCDHNIELLALDLINRQKAEIERLQSEVNALENEIERAWEREAVR